MPKQNHPFSQEQNFTTGNDHNDLQLAQVPVATQDTLEGSSSNTGDKIDRILYGKENPEVVEFAGARQTALRVEEILTLVHDKHIKPGVTIAGGWSLVAYPSQKESGSVINEATMFIKNNEKGELEKTIQITHRETNDSKTLRGSINRLSIVDWQNKEYSTCVPTRRGKVVDGSFGYMVPATDGVPKTLLPSTLENVSQFKEDDFKKVSDTIDQIYTAFGSAPQRPTYNSPNALGKVLVSNVFSR